MRKIFLLLISVLFTSCIWIPEKDYSSVRNKTTYQSFNDVQNPLVLSDFIRADFNLAGSFGSASTRRIFGSVYSIYDFENDCVKDYVYSKSKNFDSYNLQKITTSTGKVKYMDFDETNGLLHFISPDNTQIETIDAASVKGYNVFNKKDDEYRYKLFYYFDYNENISDSWTYTYTIKIFDADTNIFSEGIQFKNSRYWNLCGNKYIPEENGGDGCIWFFTWDRKDYPDRDNFYLNKINPKTGKLDLNLAAYEGVYGNEIHEWTDSASWNHQIYYYVIDSIGDDLVIRKKHSVIDGDDFEEFLLLNKNTFESRLLTDKNFEYIGISGGKFWFKKDSDYNLAAFDVNTLEQTVGFENKEINLNASTYYIQGDFIYAFANVKNKEDEYVRKISLFDAVNQKLVQTRFVEYFKFEQLD